MQKLSPSANKIFLDESPHPHSTKFLVFDKTVGGIFVSLVTSRFFSFKIWFSKSGTLFTPPNCATALVFVVQSAFRKNSFLLSDRYSFLVYALSIRVSLFWSFLWYLGLWKAYTVQNCIFAFTLRSHKWQHISFWVLCSQNILELPHFF